MRRTAAAAAETRARVLDSALLIFAEHGYDGATFERIAARIDMTRGAVHHHFRGKDELLAAVLAEQWTRYGEQVLAPLHDPVAEPAAAITAFLTGYLRSLRDDPLFRALATVTTLVASRSGLPAGRLDDHRDAFDRWRAAFAAVLGRRSALRPGIDIDAAVFVLMSIVIGANATAAVEPDRLPADDTARHAVATAVTNLLQENPA